MAATWNRGSLCASVRLLLMATVWTLALAIPACADETDTASPQSGGASSGEVSAYAKFFDVGPEEARRNLELQAQGAGLVEVLKARLGKDYAGVWFDNAAGEFVVPLLPGENMEAAINQTLASVGLTRSFRTQAVKSSWAELEAAQSRVAATLRNLGSDVTALTGIDPRTNGLEVSVGKAYRKQLSAIEEAAAANGTSLDIKQSDSAVGTGSLACVEPAACDPPLRGGVELMLKSEALKCSAGFKAVGNQFGNRFMLTAGHCIDFPNENFYAYSITPNIFLRFVGQAVQYNYRPGDWAKLSANGTYWDTNPWPSQAAYWGTSNSYSIEAESASYAGQFVCRAGFETSSPSGCAPVASLNVEDPELGKYHMTKFGPTCVAPGDSGGPVFSQHVALGIFSGWILPAPPCGQQWGLYMEVTEAADNLGVTVGPRLGTRPYAETLPPSGYSGRNATFNGEVNPHSLNTVYLFRYGTSPSMLNQSTFPANAGSAWQNVPVSKGVGGLVGGTTYYYSLLASNTAGEAASTDIESFIMPLAPPAVSLEPASGVGTSEAQLRASINPQGYESKYRFEYGPSESYGSSVPASAVAIGSGESAVKVSQEISGLQPERTYHYRLIAESSQGTSSSSDATFTTKALPASFVSSFGGKGAGNGQFTSPSGVVMSPGGLVVGGNGNVFATDSGGNRVQKFGPTGEYLGQFGTAGSGPGQFSAPLGIALNPAGHLFIGDANNHRIQEVTANGTFVAQFGPGEGSGEPLYAPWDVAVDKAGHVFAADPIRNAVYEYSVEGLGPEGNHLLAIIPYTFPEREGHTPIGLGYESGAGNVWGVDANKNRVEQYMLSCGGCAEHPAYFPRFGTSGSGPGQLTQPYDVAVRPSGSLLVLDRGNSRVQQFSQAGELLSTFAVFGSGPGQLNQPFSVAYGKGSIYIADAGNYRIERWTQAGQPEVTTQAATAIGSSGATLNTSVAPVGAATTYHFEYGPTISYGSKVPAPDEGVGSGFEVVAKSRTISGLSPKTTYHFRVVATNANGTAMGEDMTFTTS